MSTAGDLASEAGAPGSTAHPDTGRPDPPRPRPSPRPRQPGPPSVDEPEPLDPASAQSSAADEAQPVADSPPQRKALAFFGSVIAPTTVLTALLFYFGRLHADWFFRYFGVNYTVLGLSTQDYLLRSADGLFVPLTVLGAAALIGSWVFRSARHWMTPAVWRVVRALAGPIAAGLGLGLVIVSGLAVANPDAFAATLGLPGLCLAIGVLLLAAVSPLLRLRNPEHPEEPLPTVVAVGEWVACFLLVSVGLFWAAGDYSAAVGTGRGMQVATELGTSPDVVVYSEKSLRVQLLGVAERECAKADSAYGFRYDGLKLVMQAGDRYLFLPADWQPGAGPALVVPRTDSLRLEFTTPGAALSSGC
jgi:hypothetical protein